MLKYKVPARLCAYRKWESTGMPSGDGIQFWLEAEQELMQTSKQYRSVHCNHNLNQERIHALHRNLITSDHSKSGGARV